MRKAPSGAARHFSGRAGMRQRSGRKASPLTEGGLQFPPDFLRALRDLRGETHRMISALTGKLKRVDGDRVFLEAGPMQFELLVPAADVTELQASLGETLTLHTIFTLTGDPSRGGLEPTLIAFLRPEDRQFFELFTTVKGIGAKTALKALTVPVGEIAAAIESKDAKFLTRLQGIGKRTAELIVAELSGKAAKFATYAPSGEGRGGPMPSPSRRSDAEE